MESTSMNRSSCSSKHDENAEPTDVHPIIRQIIDRDCHVSESDRTVVRHVISKLRGGYDGYRRLTTEDRAQFVEDCVRHHRANRREYVDVMHRTGGETEECRRKHAFPDSLSGLELRRLIRKQKVTIRELSRRIGTSMKRVREFREQGIAEIRIVRDWIQAITGEDPGPSPEPFRISETCDQVDCSFCGMPLIAGDEAYTFVGEVFCSHSCCRKSKGWK